MYQCKKCNKPLTEFDVQFYKELYKTSSLKDCNCYQCTANDHLKTAINKHNFIKKRSYLYIIPPALIILVLLFAFIINSFGSTPPLYAILGSGITSAAFVVFWIAGAIIAIKEFNLDYDSVVVGSHYVTTSNGNGSYTTKSVNDYSDDDSLAAFGLGITYIWWCFPYYIYRCIKYRRDCPKEVRRAYKNASKCVPEIIIPKRYVEKHKNNLDKWERKVKKISEKYSILGEKEVNSRIDKLVVPPFNIRIKGKKYLVLDHVYYVYFRLEYKDDNEKKRERILLGSHFMYTESGDISKVGNWKTVMAAVLGHSI